jgi:hypothetical protein
LCIGYRGIVWLPLGDAGFFESGLIPYWNSNFSPAEAQRGLLFESVDAGRNAFFHPCCSNLQQGSDFISLPSLRLGVSAGEHGLSADRERGQGEQGKF